MLEALGFEGPWNGLAVALAAAAALAAAGWLLFQLPGGVRARLQMRSGELTLAVEVLATPVSVRLLGRHRGGDREFTTQWHLFGLPVLHYEVPALRLLWERGRPLYDALARWELGADRPADRSTDPRPAGEAEHAERPPRARQGPAEVGSGERGLHRAAGTLAGLRRQLEETRPLWEGPLDFAARGTRIRRLRLDLHLGLGDALTSAVATGAAWGLIGPGLAALQGRFPFEREPEISVQPRYAGRQVEMDAELVARIHQGRLVAAGFWAGILLFLRKASSRRRLRASAAAARGRRSW